MGEKRVKKITELNRKSVEEYKELSKRPLVVVIDNVRSLNNIGSIFRSADAFLVERILICGISATPPHADIHKTALGAEDAVEWEYYESTVDAVKSLKKQGYEVYAVEQVHNSVSLSSLSITDSRKTAIVLGNEIKGVTQDVVDVCDYCVEIEQYGTKHSLNVAVVAGIVIWEFSEFYN